MNNIFEGAKIGDKFTCRNGANAFYWKYIQEANKHALIVDDNENDYIRVYDDGHVFHVDNYKDTTFERYKLNKEELREYKLDIISHH